MHDILVVKCPQASSNMNQGFPNFILWKLRVLSSVSMDQIKEVPFACELHNYVKNGSMMVIKCLFEVHNMVSLMWGEKSYLIESIISIFFLDPGHSNLHKGSNTFFMA